MFRPDHIAPPSRENELHIILQRGDLLSDMRSAQLCLIDRRQLEGHGWRVVRRQFLGFWHDQPCYALEIDEVELLTMLIREALDELAAGEVKA